MTLISFVDNWDIILFLFYPQGYTTNGMIFFYFID